MKLIPLVTENWKVDGGTVFGVVPKAIWNSITPADEQNLVKTTCRVLLVEDGNRLILIDTGMGNKQNEKFFSHRHLFKSIGLIEALRQAGYYPEQITDVIFTHLHYDHVGGAVVRKGDDLELVFRNAKHWVSRAQLDWAMNPNKREAASFLPENILPLIQSASLNLLEGEGLFSDHITLRIFNGHTRGQIIPLIDYNGITIVYTADFLASSAHIPLPWIPSYDIEPLITLEEKEMFLQEAADKGFVIVLEHDYFVEAITVTRTPKGVRLAESGTLTGLIDRKRHQTTV